MAHRPVARLIEVAAATGLLLLVSACDENNITSPGSPTSGKNVAPILFMTGRDGNREIYRMYADGSEQTRLTAHPYEDLNAR